VTRRRVRWAAAAAAVLVGAVTAGCTTARSDLGSSVSSCYPALPAATKAVGDHGHLLGVQQFTVASLHRQAPNLYRALSTNQPSAQRVCVLAFSGPFDAHSVDRARGRAKGRLAVVVSVTPGNRLLGTVIFASPPFRMGRAHTG
jgi:hypothetical protein